MLFNFLGSKNLKGCPIFANKIKNLKILGFGKVFERKSKILDLAFDFICRCPHIRKAEGLYETRIQPMIHSRIEVKFRNSQLAD